MNFFFAKFGFVAIYALFSTKFVTIYTLFCSKFTLLFPQNLLQFPCTRNVRNLLTILIYEKCSKFCIYYHPKWIKGLLTTKNTYIFTCFNNNTHIILPFFLKIIPNYSENCTFIVQENTIDAPSLCKKIGDLPTPPFWSHNICMLPLDKEF